MNKNYIFSNYGYSDEYISETRQFIFDEYGEYEEWESPDDIPDNRVWNTIYADEELCFEDAMRELEDFFKCEKLIITGRIGRWNGTFDGGKIMDIEDIHDCWKDCDYIEIYDEGGHLYIDSYHHDGGNHFEVKILTEKGIDYYDRWNYNWDDKRTDREVFTRLMKNSNYSHIPHFAKKVYGCKER